MTEINSSRARPVYVASGAETLFAMFHDAAPGDGAAVLLCSPWGWEETASYRCRRAWAERLAAAGHPTLRFDLPAVGNSTGNPGDPGRVAAWVAAVADAADWLRRTSGRSRLAVIGLGLGGLLASRAAELGAEIDEIVLWAVPTRGKRFVREADSFARLQAGGAGRGQDSPLPEGWLEAGGFVLSAETANELRTMDPPFTAVPGGLGRALLVDRDGMAPDNGLRERLEAGGVDTEVAPGPGWGKMVFHPERAILPVETIERIESWLAAGDELPAPERGPAAESAEAASDSLEFELEDGRGRESAFSIDQSYGRSFGIVAEPEGERRGDFCAVFLNAGAVRHIGPNRNWVENARRWAARGVPTVRVDLEGIGEADGELAAGDGGFYDEVYEGQITRILDALEARGLGPNFVCLGLCSGAFWSLHLADRDPRVRAGVLLNSGAIFWSTELRAQRKARLLSGAIFSADSWRKLARREVDFVAKARLLRGLVVWRVKRLAARFRGGSESAPAPNDIGALFDRLRLGDKRIAMAFCENEPVLAELRADGIVDRIADWPNLELGALVGEDHALGPIDAQRSAEELIDRELSRALAAAPAPAAPRI